MTAIDTYKTISGVSLGEFKDRGSKFIAYAAPVATEDEAKDIIEMNKKEHPKSRHHCYAYRIGFDGNLFRANDAGEPSGTAGKPILGQIDSFGLTNVLVVVSRYFGGTLLGTSGLINAYRSAAAEALQHADIIEKVLEDHYLLTFEYEQMSDVMGHIKKENIYIVDQKFELNCAIEISIRKSNAKDVIESFNFIDKLEISYICTT